MFIEHWDIDFPKPERADMCIALNGGIDRIFFKVEGLNLPLNWGAVYKVHLFNEPIN